MSESSDTPEATGYVNEPDTITKNNENRPDNLRDGCTPPAEGKIDNPYGRSCFVAQPDDKFTIVTYRVRLSELCTVGETTAIHFLGGTFPDIRDPKSVEKGEKAELTQKLKPNIVVVDPGSNMGFLLEVLYPESERNIRQGGTLSSLQ
jgi:hypothetical protein